MVTNIIMPKFGLSMEEGTIGSWLKKEGDSVSKGDALAEVATDKITNTVEATGDGVLRKIVVLEGETVPCGSLICIVADAGDDISGEGETPKVEEAVAVQESPAVLTVASPILQDNVIITPRAKKIAEEKGLEYSHIKGTGINGAITIDDLKRFGRPISTAAPVALVAPVAPVVPAAPIAPAPVASIQPVQSAPLKLSADAEIIQMTPIQGTIFKRMQESISTTAQTTICTEADVTPLTKVYNGLKGKYKIAGLKLSYTAMIIKAVAQALENHPKIRTKVVDANHTTVCNEINIGVAVDTPNGLVVPVIKHANLKDLRSICIELADLSDRAKKAALKSEDMENGVITITNLGMFNITYFTPILNIPESTILGIGAIIQKVLVKDNSFFIGSVLNMSLTHDHRIIDGAPGARFLQEVTANLADFKWL